MGFFKNMSKAYKQANKASNSRSGNSNRPSKPVSAPPLPPNKQPVPNIDPADLVLPDEVATSIPGLTLSPTKNRHRYEINIVGESYRQGNIKALVNLVDTKEFQIYLIGEPNNPHDKNAVAVYAAGVQVGYLSSETNKPFAKAVKTAVENKELIWGNASARSRTGDLYGVFGYVYIDNFIAPDEDTLTAKELKPAALEKAIVAALALEDADYPETVAQVKSLAKKACKAATPLYCHALWVDDTSTNEKDRELWDAIRDACSTVFDDAEEHAFVDDADDSGIDSTISDLADAIRELQAAGQQPASE